MPGTLTVLPTVPKLEQKKRVAAYARVSSGKDAMLRSLSAQISYYSEYIRSNSEWIYAGVYADEAKTGTKANREGFQRLIADCRAGNIDMILTKSISRFTRNTLTLLQTVRACKAIGVDIYFEEQNIHTMSGDGELMLSILASYAQEESRSASENQKWRIRKLFEAGKPWSGTIYGYRCEKREYIVVPEEAGIIENIFEWYLAGNGYNTIAKRLNAEGHQTRSGKPWYQSAVMVILRNYVYTGNLLLQKTYRENYMTKRKLFNQGELPMYHAEETHEAIISREMFEAVQTEIARRSARFTKPVVCNGAYPFSRKMECGVCGASCHRKETHAGPVWICRRFHSYGKAVCASKQIPEDILMSETAKVLEQAVFDEQDFRDRVDHILLCNGNILIYHFKDGTEIQVQWKDRSRSQSWTDEMKAAARQRALERNRSNAQSNGNTIDH